MLNTKRILGLLGILLMTGCVTNNEIKTIQAENMTSSNGSIISIGYTGGFDYYQNYRLKPIKDEMKNLRMVTRGDNASAVAGDATKTILCNPFSLFNLIGACRAKIYTHSKHDLSGSDTGIENVAKSYAYPKYKALLRQYVNPEKSDDYSMLPIAFEPKKNYLVYDNNGYKLFAGFNISTRGTPVEGKFVCDEQKTGITKERWQANNYRLAVEEGKKLIDRCFKRLTKSHFDSIGILLKEERPNFL